MHTGQELQHGVRPIPSPGEPTFKPICNDLVSKFLVSVCSILVISFIFPTSEEPPFPRKDFLHTLGNTVGWQLTTLTFQLTNSSRKQPFLSQLPSVGLGGGGGRL